MGTSKINPSLFTCSLVNCTEIILICAVCQIVTRWHHNETNPNSTLTTTLKVTVIYAVKDNTEIKLLLVL